MTRKLNFRRLNKVIAMLFELVEKMDNKSSEVSKQWHYMHIVSCSQLIKPEAKKRGLSMELAALAAALHDYGLLITGKKENHAETGALMLNNFFKEYNREFGPQRGKITEEEQKIITSAVLHHSEKDIDSNESYTELLKDIDCLDRYLHGVLTEGTYLRRVRKLYKNFFG